MAYTTQDDLRDICRRLSLLVTDVHLSNRHNFQDINVSSEPFLARLINLIRGTNFIDLNTQEKTNTSGIDIGDKTTGESIQITSTATHKKVQDSINTFEKNHLNNGYTSISVLILTVGKVTLAKDFIVNSQHKFTIQDNIFTVDDLYIEVSRLDPQRITEIRDFIASEIKLDDSEKFTREIFLLRNYFKTVENVDQNSLDEVIDEFDSADLAIKRKRFDSFWDHLQQTYLSVMDQRLEKTFKTVYDGLDQPERENLKKYLRYESTKLLLIEENPVETIELLKTKMIEQMKMNLISEMSVLNFLYYQFYRCNVFPLRQQDGN